MTNLVAALPRRVKGDLCIGPIRTAYWRDVSLGFIFLLKFSVLNTRPYHDLRTRDGLESKQFLGFDHLSNGRRNHLLPRNITPLDSRQNIRGVN